MAKQAKKTPAALSSNADKNDFSQELIEAINKERGGDRIAFNLAFDTAPTNIDRWISTGSEQLDMIIANKPGGGFPEGRIIEIYGPPSIGKSLFFAIRANWLPLISILILSCPRSKTIWPKSGII